MMDFLCDLSKANRKNLELEKEIERLENKYERLQIACYEFIGTISAYRENVHQESILMRHKLRKIGEEK